MIRRVGKPSAMVAALAVAALAVAGLVPSSSVASTRERCPLPVFGPGSAYHPKIVPGHFSPRVTNPWFPLKAGSTLVYTGVKDEQRALNIVTATSRTRRVDGVKTRVVEDRLYLDNVLRERTSDYYAQDRCGNVWYFGEDTAELDEHGHRVSTEGTFHAGVDGAQPGVVMQARPEVGRVFRQEWYPGHAEDRFWVLSRDASIRVPYGSFRHALRTAEATDLEPDVLDNKYYARGIGQVAELSGRGPAESLRLVEIIS
ncbi:MAG TPA: hypothetical protein VH969_20570 [Actinophytocola sp.]|jgi:hypothetical protein|uniref:hypothetical protein n=1 Tax=Actinophytocola sp. TaxID=1872138 RepID=UPI002F93058D